MRLKKSWQFRKVYDEGKKQVSDYAVVFFCEHPTGHEGPGIGVVASKRIGNAVKRNRAKRLLRVAAHHLSGKLNNRNVWIVLVARSNINDRHSSEVVGDIGRAMELAGLITRRTSN